MRFALIASRRPHSSHTKHRLSTGPWGAKRSTCRPEGAHTLPWSLRETHSTQPKRYGGTRLSSSRDCELELPTSLGSLFDDFGSQEASFRVPAGPLLPPIWRLASLAALVQARASRPRPFARTRSPLRVSLLTKRSGPLTLICRRQGPRLQAGDSIPQHPRKARRMPS